MYVVEDEYSIGFPLITLVDVLNVSPDGKLGDILYRYPPYPLVAITELVETTSTFFINVKVEVEGLTNNFGELKTSKENVPVAIRLVLSTNVTEYVELDAGTVGKPDITPVVVLYDNPAGNL